MKNVAVEKSGKHLRIVSMTSRETVPPSVKRPLIRCEFPSQGVRVTSTNLSRLLLGGLALTVGVALGIGGFTFSYAKGLSYLSTDPAACANCHIMQRQYDGWQQASHHTVARCVDCHLPHTFFAKYYEKAENGWRHSRMFTLDNFHEPIELTPRAQRILTTNCVDCHSEITAELSPESSWHGAAASADCLHCHSFVGHGPRAALGPALNKTP